MLNQVSNSTGVRNRTGKYYSRSPFKDRIREICKQNSWNFNIALKNQAGQKSGNLFFKTK